MEAIFDLFALLIGAPLFIIGLIIFIAVVLMIEKFVIKVFLGIDD